MTYGNTICLSCFKTFVRKSTRQNYCNTICRKNGQKKISELAELYYLEYACASSRKKLTELEKKILHENKEGYFREYNPPVEYLLTLPNREVL